MTNLKLLVMCLLLICALVNCGIPASTMKALQNAEQYELLYLYPVPPEKKSSGDFHGWKILGRTSIADVGTRRKLNDALEAGVRSSDDTSAACFDPRHGIRVIVGGKVTDLVICFECWRVRVWSDGQQTQSFAP